MIRYLRAPLAWLLFCAVPASATNLLNNPDFDTDLAGWITSCGEVPGTWDGSAGSPAAGSLYMQAIVTSSCIAQCVNIAGGQSVDLSIRSKGDLCADDSEYAGAYLNTFDQAD